MNMFDFADIVMEMHTAISRTIPLNWERRD